MLVSNGWFLLFFSFLFFWGESFIRRCPVLTRFSAPLTRSFLLHSSHMETLSCNCETDARNPQLGQPSRETGKPHAATTLQHVAGDHHRLRTSPDLLLNRQSQGYGEGIPRVQFFRDPRVHGPVSLGHDPRVRVVGPPDAGAEPTLDPHRDICRDCSILRHDGGGTTGVSRIHKLVQAGKRSSSLAKWRRRWRRHGHSRERKRTST